MEKIKIGRPIIVEGKYDKIALQNVVDGLIIPTDGFGIFKDRDKCRMIRDLAMRFGIVVVTDSDNAGNMIRSYIKNIAGGGRITNVYVPEIKGKEKRKRTGSKQRLLGVEGMDPQVLRDAFLKSGVPFREECDARKITKADMYEYGLSGCEGSSRRRAELLKRLELPVSLSPSAMLDVLNTVLTYEEFCEVADFGKTV